MLDNKSLNRHFSVKYRCKFLLIICILTRPSGSLKYCMTRKKKYSPVILHTKMSNKIYVVYYTDTVYLWWWHPLVSVVTVSWQYHSNQSLDLYNSTVLFHHHWQNEMGWILWHWSHKVAVQKKTASYKLHSHKHILKIKMISGVVLVAAVVNLAHSRSQLCNMRKCKYLLVLVKVLI